MSAPPSLRRLMPSEGLKGLGTCNPSYSGGRDQEDHSPKPAQANKFMRPYLENT
jgi:hypothetical protein